VVTLNIAYRTVLGIIQINTVGTGCAHTPRPESIKKLEKVTTIVWTIL